MMPSCTSVATATVRSPDFDRLVAVAKRLWASSKTQDAHFHVTFALRRKRTMAYGINKRATTHPRNCQIPYIGMHTGHLLCKEIGVHSEMACILRLGRESCRDITFVNVRIGLSGQVLMAKPCFGCGHLLRQIGFRNVFYSTAEGEFALWNPAQIIHWPGGGIIRQHPGGVNLVHAVA